MNASILVVSQDQELIKTVTSVLEKDGHKISKTNNADVALNLCKSQFFDIAIVDTHLPSFPYETIIPEIKKSSSETEIVIITGYTIPEAMVKLEKSAINHFIILPLTPEEIRLAVNRVLRQLELLRENRRLLVAVTAAKKEWEATVDAIEEPIFVTDFDYKILRANLATFQILGKGVNEVLGHRCYEIFHCAREPDPTCPGKKARDSGEPATDTISFKGLKKRMTCSVYPQVFEGGGGLVHFLHEPITGTEQEAQTLAKYERLFDDACIPIIVVGLEDYKITDANQQALSLLDYEPEKMVDLDWENIFAPDIRENTINELLQQILSGRASVKSKLLDKNYKEIEVQINANLVEVGNVRFIELFFIK